VGAVGLDSANLRLRRFRQLGPNETEWATDLVLCNVNTGAFEAYDLGLEWQLGGFAVDPAASGATRARRASCLRPCGLARVQGDSYSSPFLPLQAQW
jgi:hypothetical protein